MITRPRAARTLVVAAAAIALLATAASAIVIPGPSPEWGEALAAYVRDPRVGKRQLLPLARQGTAELPPVYLLAVGDAYLRANRAGPARHFFERVLGTQAGPPWEGWAVVGLAWAEVQSNDLAHARARLAEVAERGTDGGAFGRLLLALLDASGGNRAGIDELDRLHLDAAVPEPVRQAAGLAAGYARWWCGDDDGARAAFEQLAASPAAGPLADDAAYGAAISHGADSTAVAAALERLAGGRTPAGRSVPVSAALLDLQPQAVLRAGFERYRRLPLLPLETQAASLFDGDGRAMARRQLARMRAVDAAAPDHEPHAPAPMVVSATLRPADHRGTPEQIAPASTEQAPPDPWRRWLALGTIAAMVMLVIVRSGRRVGSGAAPRRPFA